MSSSPRERLGPVRERLIIAARLEARRREPQQRADGCHRHRGSGRETHELREAAGRRRTEHRLPVERARELIEVGLRRKMDDRLRAQRGAQALLLLELAMTREAATNVLLDDVALLRAEAAVDEPRQQLERTRMRD